MPPPEPRNEPPPPIEEWATPSRDAGVDRANDELPAKPRPLAALMPPLKPRCTPRKLLPADVRAKLLAVPPRNEDAVPPRKDEAEFPWNDDAELPRNADAVWLWSKEPPWKWSPLSW